MQFKLFIFYELFKLYLMLTSYGSILMHGIRMFNFQTGFCIFRKHFGEGGGEA